MPGFTWSALVGQGAAPAGATGELAVDAALEAAGIVAVPVGAGGVAAGPPGLLLVALPHAAARGAAQVSATAAIARRATRRVESITVALLAGSAPRAV
jgi:hypothetical protein